jgi:hypothetical protein
MSGRRSSDLLPLAELPPGFETLADETPGAVPNALTVQGRHHFTRTKPWMFSMPLALASSARSASSPTP